MPRIVFAGPVIQRAINIVVAGFLCGLMSVALGLGNSALIARGELLPLLTPIASAVLMATAILPIATTAFSSLRGQVSTTQEIAVVALAAVTGATNAAFAAAPEALLATILVTIGVTTALTGVAMYALGALRLGRITRYVPYPVFAGFLAITGWYLITGGLETIIGGHLGWHRLAEFAEPDTALKVGLALGFVAAVEIANRRFPSGVALPVGAMVAIVLFNIATATLGTPQAELAASGWVATVPPSGLGWPPVGWDQLAMVDWNAVGAGLLFAPFVIIITTAGAMMNVSGIELDLRRDVDLNAELRAIGVGNLFAGLAGGIPGFPAVSTTMLADRMGAWHRATGLVTGAVALLALGFAPLVFARIPMPLLGGLLIWVGVSLTMDWLVRPLRTLRRSEYAIILVILGVSIGAGLPAGIAMGLLTAVVLFAIEYARVDGVRYIASGRDLHSRTVSQKRRMELAERGDAITIIKLSGYLFFGTADRIVQRIMTHAAAARGDDAWCAVLDFSRVTGFDSSTVLSFERLRRIAERDGFNVVLAGLGPMADRLVAGGLDIALPPFHQAPDLEAALHWSEARLLGGDTDTVVEAVAANVSLLQLLGEPNLADAISTYLERVEYGDGERLIIEGSRAEDILIIESGHGQILLDAQHGGPLVLMEFGPGSILGEIAFYGHEPRSATAMTRAAGVAWRLTRASLEKVVAEQPAAAAAFHMALARVLAERLQSANRLIRVLAD